MGKIVVFVSVSVDGMFEGPNADISWHRVDAEVHRYFNQLLFSAGAVLSGRVNHQMMVEFWPTADADPAAPAEIAEFASFFRDVPKVVLSTTMVDDGQWNTTVARSLDPVAMRSFADSLDGDLFVGGGQVIDAFRRADLVDEWKICVHPIVVGEGRPLFTSGGPPVDLELVDIHRFGNGAVMLHYAVPRSDG